LRRLTVKRPAKLVILGLVLTVGALAAHRYMPAHSTVLFAEWLRSLHGPGFAAIAAIIYFAIGPRRSAWSRFWLAAASAGMIAVLAEASQIPGERNAELVDLLTDAIGIIAALGLAASLDARVRKHSGQPIRAALALATAAAITVTFLPTTWIGYAIFQQHRAVPSLLSFEHRWESLVYDLPDDASPELVTAPTNWPGPGGTVALIQKGERDRTFLIVHPPPDWRGYGALSFVAAAKGRPFSLDVAIRYSQPLAESPSLTYEQSIALAAGAQRYRIAFDDFADTRDGHSATLAHVESLILSPTDPGSKQQLLIDDIRLER
jgi:VanZ family protein